MLAAIFCPVSFLKTSSAAEILALQPTAG